MTRLNDARLPALVVTVLFGVALAALLMYLHLSLDPAKKWPPEPEPYIELAVAEEFIEPEPITLPAKAPETLDAPAQLTETKIQDSKAAEQSGSVLENRGPKAEPAKPVTTTKPSPVKAVEPPKQTKTGVAVDNAKKEQEAAAKRTNSQVADAFGGKNNANTATGDVGKSGRTDGKPTSGGPATSNSASVGVNKGRLGGGWMWPNYNVAISTSLSGKIVVELVIDRNGNATVKSVTGTPPAAGNSTLEAQCIRIATSRKFTNSNEDPTKIPDQTTARLTFNFSK